MMTKCDKIVTLFTKKKTTAQTHIVSRDPADRMTCALDEARTTNKVEAIACPATPIARSRLYLEPPPAFVSKFG